MSWNEFEELASIIVQDILSKKFNKEKVCLLGTARGALPLLTYISHKTGIRNISIIQFQMTNSDEPFDYGKVRLLLEAIREDLKEFIVLEDIVYKGNTVKEVINILNKKNKNVQKVYSLVVDEGFTGIPNIQINAMSIIKNEEWVKFPWE